MTYLPRLCWKRHRSSLLKTVLGVSVLSTGLIVLVSHTGYLPTFPRQTRLEEALKVQFNHMDPADPPLSAPPHPPPPSPRRSPPPPKEAQQPQEEKRYNTTNSAEDRMRRRLAQAQSYCSQRQTATHQASFHNAPLCSYRHHSEFCIMGKVGSTFWTRFYKTLRISSSDTVPSPYKLPLSTAERCNERKPLEVKGRRPLLRGMFVRDPFSRVLSAYVDKLVSPNPIFWRGWGKPAIPAGRGNRVAPQCGQAVTFQQFVRFVIDKLHKHDVHVMPMTLQCDPCDKRYDVIGNMETLPEDLNHLMSLLNVSFQSDVRLSQETKLDAIYDSIQGPFSWMRDVKKCVSTQEMGRRIWRKLQIRGLVSSRLDYPLGNRDLTDMKAAQFYEAAVNAHKNSTDARELSHQKRQAFREAFLSLSPKDLREFVQVYSDDFQAFGFQSFLSLELGEPLASTSAFDYDQKWVVGETGGLGPKAGFM